MPPLAIAISSEKGGVGKTTTAVNLAVEFGARGLNVLVLDLDAQGAASAWLGFPEASDELLRVFTERAPLLDAVHATAHRGVSLAPAGRWFAPVESHLHNTPMSESLLKRAIAKLPAGYDLVLMDCPPTLGRLSISALVAATAALIPVGASLIDVQALPQMLETIGEVATYGYNEDLKVAGILLTKVDRTVHAREMHAGLTTYHADLLLHTSIRETVALRYAANARLPIRAYLPGSGAAADYAALADELAVRLALGLPALVGVES